MKKILLSSLFLSFILGSHVWAETEQVENLCDALKGYKATEEECAKCPNRKSEVWGGELICVLRECPKGYFQNYEGTCYSCDMLEVPYPRARDGECAKCPNRKLNGMECALKECPANHVRFKGGTCVPDKIFESELGAIYPAEPIKDNCCINCEIYEGYCIWNRKETNKFIAFKEYEDGLNPVIKSCEAVIDYKTTKLQCDSCPNRKYKNGVCSLKENKPLPMEEIPSDAITTHILSDKKCVCNNEFCEETYHDCIDWEKRYNQSGKLESYTSYDIKKFNEVMGSYWAGRFDDNAYMEIKKYSITFYESGKIKSIGNENGVQHYDEDGDLVKKCDLFRDAPSGRITCSKWNKWLRKWETETHHWIR